MLTKNIFLNLTLLASATALAAILGCGGGDTKGGGGSTSATTTTGATTTGDTGSTTTGAGGDISTPNPPAIGAQIDRFGRPAINTALNKTFETDMAKKNAGKDAYNADTAVDTWAATYSPEFAANAAVLDGLDGKCGNQLFAGMALDPTRYQKIAGTLADDRLWINSEGATCTTYLAVEANATMLIPNMDCGGRKLDYDVIETSYSALAIGALKGVDDGVVADMNTKGTTFPYLAAPH